MNQCVPRSNSKDQPNFINHPFSMLGFSERDVRMNNEVKELTWRDGKPQLGTLESVVEQATRGLAGAVAHQPSNVSWLAGEVAGEMNLGSREGSCSGDGGREMEEACRWSSPEKTWEFCGASLSPENISSGEGWHSLCRSKSSQGDEEIEKKNNKKKKKNKKVMRRSKAVAIHNQFERKRRDRINQKIRALQKLVPNSRKTDKASILDEVIKYMKQLQNQVKMMTCISHMMMMMITDLQMSMMAQMAQMAQMTQMGLGLRFMDLGSFLRPMPLLPLHHPLAYPPSACSTLSNSFLAFMQQSMNMEAYKKMVAMYQQLNQQQNKVNPEN